MSCCDTHAVCFLTHSRRISLRWSRRQRGKHWNCWCITQRQTTAGRFTSLLMERGAEREGTHVNHFCIFFSVWIRSVLYIMQAYSVFKSTFCFTYTCSVQSWLWHRVRLPASHPHTTTRVKTTTRHQSNTRNPGGKAQIWGQELMKCEWSGHILNIHNWMWISPQTVLENFSDASDGLDTNFHVSTSLEEQRAKTCGELKHVTPSWIIKQGWLISFTVCEC